MNKLAVELIKDYGSETFYRVLDVIFLDQTHKRTGRFYAYTTPEQGLRVRNAIMNNNKLTLTKDKLNKIVSFDDFKQNEVNSVQEKKIVKVREIYKILDEKMAIVTGLSLYSFFSDMVRLAAHGYFITDSNREEVYLKIIDSADEDLISCLETYLDSKDRIDEVTAFHRRATSLIRDLENAETDEEIEKALEDYEQYGIY
jgi:hypothetical protein